MKMSMCVCVKVNACISGKTPFDSRSCELTKPERGTVCPVLWSESEDTADTTVGAQKDNKDSV